MEVELTEYESELLRAAELRVRAAQRQVQELMQALDEARAELLRAVGEKDGVLKMIKARLKAERNIDLDIAGPITLSDDFRRIIIHGEHQAG